MGSLRMANVARYPKRLNTASHDARTTDQPYKLALFVFMLVLLD